MFQMCMFQFPAYSVLKPIRIGGGGRFVNFYPNSNLLTIYGLTTVKIWSAMQVSNTGYEFFLKLMVCSKMGVMLNYVGNTCDAGDLVIGPRR